MTEDAAAPTVQRIDHRDAAGAVTLRINRPEVRNALGRRELRLLNAHLMDCQFDSSVRVIFLTGAGEAFCSGADLKARNDRDSGETQSISDLSTEVTTRIVTMPKIVIVAMNGAAAGMGCHIAICSDLCLASTTANFHFTGATKGIPSQQFGALILPLTIGLKRAKGILLRGGRLSARRALDLGLINELVEPDAWEATLQDWAATLVKADPRVMAHNKFQMNQLAFQQIGALKLSTLAGAAYHASVSHLPSGRVAEEKEL